MLCEGLNYLLFAVGAADRIALVAAAAWLESRANLLGFAYIKRDGAKQGDFARLLSPGHLSWPADSSAFWLGGGARAQKRAGVRSTNIRQCGGRLEETYRKAVIIIIIIFPVCPLFDDNPNICTHPSQSGRGLILAGNGAHKTSAAAAAAACPSEREISARANLRTESQQFSI